MKKLLAASLFLGSTVAVASPFVVKHIEVKGIEGAQKAQFLKGLPIKAGNRIDENTLSGLVVRLYQQGYQSQAVRSGNNLILTVQPPLVINRVTFREEKGILPSQQVTDNLDKIGLVAGNVLNKQAVEEVRQAMLSALQSAGYANAKVEAKETRLPDNKVNLFFDIQKGDTTKIETLKIEGNKAFSASDLEAEMDLHAQTWWRIFGGKYAPAQMPQHLQALETFYRNKGYPLMRVVDVKPVFNKDKTLVDLSIVINEGQRFDVTNARIVGDLGGISPEKFQPALKAITLGKDYHLSEINAVRDDINATLGEYGFYRPDIQIVPKFNKENHTMEVTYVVNAGRRYSVREIRFEGNTISADSTLRQEMRQQEGAWLSETKVALGKRRLDQTGFFDSVDAVTVPVQGTPDQVDVVYKVHERLTGQINFGLGYGTDGGFSYNAAIKQNNFLGTGAALTLSGSHNDNGNNLNFGYTEPYFTKDGVSLGGNVFYDDYDNSKNDNAASYAKKSFGANVQLGFPVNENNSYYIGAGFISNHLKNVTPEYHRWLYKDSMGYDSWTFKANDFPLFLGWRYNTLNRGFFPTDGSSMSLGGRAMLPNSKNKYYTLDLDMQTYYPLDRDQHWVLHGKLSGNYANGFGGKRVPFYQLYSAGGIGSLRGFSYGSIGPKALYCGKDNPAQCDQARAFTKPSNDVIGGNVMATASAELIFPIPFMADKSQQNLRTTAFVDAATVWDSHWKKDNPWKGQLSDNDGDPKRIRASAGVSLSWFSPIGLLSFSYAKPIKKYKDDDIEQFQFNVGGSF